MTDRYNALIVVLEVDTRSDDAEQVIEAIKMLRGVASVTPNVSNFEHHIAKMQVRSEMKQRFLDLVMKD